MHALASPAAVGYPEPVMKRTLQQVAVAVRESQTRVVLVGGVAVNQHGISRQTFDIDFVIPDTEEVPLAEALQRAGFRTMHRTENFHRFRPPHPDGFIADFLFLDRCTFDQMWDLGEDVELAGCRFRVAAPEHLIRMKLHALRFGRADRMDKDLGDVLQLMRKCGWTPETPAFREACLKHGTEEAYAAVRQRWTLRQT
jgi:hypothetical protein